MSDGSSVHRLAAVLSTDLVGYSGYMSADETLTDQVVSGVMARKSEMVLHHQGRVTHTAGDGLIAVFESALSALCCGVEMAKGEGEAEAILGNRLRFRTGLTIGEVIHKGKEVFGDTVNLAKRLEQEAEPGWVCVSRALYEQVRNKCSFGFEFLGPRSLKNIPDPIEVYRVLEDASLGILAPAKRGPPPPLTALPSIAVMPLVDLSEDRTKGWLCDGIAERMIDRLARFKDLLVISRNSSFLLKGADLTAADVGRQLGVRYLLQGSIRSVKNQARVTVRLVDANSHATVWGETYHGNLSDVFDLEDEVSTAIAGVLHGRIEETEIHHVRRGSVGQTAYTLLVRAKACYRSLDDIGFAEFRGTLPPSYQCRSRIWLGLGFPVPGAQHKVAIQYPVEPRHLVERVGGVRKGSSDAR